MPIRRMTILAAELRESFLMAMGAVAAHKLRSALTLLGVLVGVFSIIVVMTAMRVMQNDIEAEFRELGSHTFQIQKFPVIFFDRPEGMEKIWRRKNITLQEGLRLQDKLTLASAVGIDTSFWGGQVETRYKKTAPDVRLFGETPGSFPAKNWTLENGRALADSDVGNARDVCVLGSGLAKAVFPFGSAVGERLKIDGINYSVIGVLEAKGNKLGGDEDNFAIIPITTGLDRFGSTWRSLNILVQARDQGSYDACLEEARGVFRVIRKVPPGEEDSFDIASNDSVIAQFNSFTLVVRAGVAVISSMSLLAAGIGIMNIILVSLSGRPRYNRERRVCGRSPSNRTTYFTMDAFLFRDDSYQGEVVIGIVGCTA